MQNEPVFIVSARRSAIGSFGGSLSQQKICSVAATVTRTAMNDAHVDPNLVDEIIFGNVLQAGLGQNPARQVAIGAGIGEEKPSFTINKVCASSMKAICLGAQSIRCGENSVVVAGGLENMSAAPYLLQKARFGYRLGDDTLMDSMVHDGLWDVFNDYHMGITAENLVKRFSLSREALDRLSYESHLKAHKAQTDGAFAGEIVPLHFPGKKETVTFTTDECIRPDTQLEKMAKLKPAFTENGAVTAGNSSSIADGTAVLILASGQACKKYSLAPCAKITGYASAGVNPSEMGLGVVASTTKLFQKLALSPDKIDLFEINEAFASVALAAEQELKIPRQKINVHGGAIALGHPIGASGARIVVSLIHALKRHNLTSGCASLCIGGGMGMAIMVERV